MAITYPERPVKGQVAHIVDQVGATFAFPSEVMASIAESAERASGAENLTRFTYVVPFDGMTWDEVADHACTWGPQGEEGCDNNRVDRRVMDERSKGANVRDLPRESVRVLVAPCGHVAGLDMTTDIPGFCRSFDEAEEDLLAGFTERRASLDEAIHEAKQECGHEPKWGIE